MIVLFQSAKNSYGKQTENEVEIFGNKVKMFDNGIFVSITSTA